jgi:hypothetical protein
MKRKFIYAIGLLSAGLFILNACQHEILYPGNGGGGTGGGGTGGTGDGGTGAVNTCSPDTVYFVNDIMPLISSNCTMSGCHDAITHADGVDLTSYTKIMRYVSAGNASGSKLYKEIIKTGSERMPLASDAGIYHGTENHGTEMDQPGCEEQQLCGSL